MRQNRLSDAKKDFLRAIEIDSQKYSGYIGLGDCYRACQDYRNAIKNYSIVIGQEDHLMEIIGLKRVICYIELKDSQMAIADVEKVHFLNKILTINPKNCEALYFKGLIAKNNKDFKKAVLTFEEVISLNLNESTTLKSIHEIALIRIEERDIYQAYYTLDRLDSIPPNVGYLQKSKTFLEGAISMVKKKFKEGLEYLDKLVNEEDLDKLLKPLVLSYRAFGNFSEGNIQAALADYNTLKSRHQLTAGDEYNLLLCEGILAANDSRWNTARQKFEWANRMNPSKIEPRFYLAILSIISFLPEDKVEFDKYLEKPDSDNAQNYLKKLTLVVYEALESLEAILAENDSCPNLIFYIGYLKLAIGLQNEAVENFSVAIEKSEDNHSWHFIWKGIALCMSDNYDEALNEFRIALNINTSCYQAALFKGRCYLHKKEIERAMYAFKDFIEGNPEEEQELKYYLGNFFFHNGLPSHAKQVYEEAVEIKPLERTLRELVKVYIIEKNLFLALDKLELLSEQYPDDCYCYDLQILLALRAASSGEFHEAKKTLTSLTKGPKNFIFSETERLFYLGLVNFYLKNYEASLKLFIEAKSLKYKGEPNQEEEEIYLTAVFAEEPDDDSSLVGQIFTYLEIAYDIAMCHLMLGRVDACIESLRPLIQADRTAVKTQELVECLQGNSEGNPEIFPSANRLCGIYEPITASIPGLEGKTLSFRLSFCLPSIELPDTCIKVSFEILSDLKITSVESKPEAPWIKRTEEGIIFTSDIISTEASEVRDLNELLTKLAANKNEVVNTKIKLNAEKIFESRQYKDLKDDEDKASEKNKLLRLKKELMLDPKTAKALDKIATKKE